LINDDTCPMFDLDLMNYFYDPDYENDMKVINAWYIYVFKILTIVSKKWRDSTAPDKLSNEKSMFSFITISDEALMRWLLIIWVANLTKKNSDHPNVTNSDKENEDNTLGSKMINQDEKSKPSKKKRGPHDTNTKINIYTKLFHEIKKARSDYDTAVRWNLIFWSEVRRRNENILEETTASSKRSNFFAHASDLPLPDLNENQEFLASYSIAVEDKTDHMYCENNNASVEMTQIAKV
jgi:hypothetical protein